MKLTCLTQWSLLLTCLLSMSSAHEDHHHHHHHHHSQSERKLKNSNIFDKDEMPSSPDEPSLKGGEDKIEEKEGDHYTCGTADPTDEEIANIRKLVSDYKEDSRGDFRTNVTVPICFHVIMTTNGDGALTDEQLQLQVDALNVAFSSSSCCNDRLHWCQTGTCSSETGFRFRMRNDCTTRTMNDYWYYASLDSDANVAMKKTLRVGGPDVLNVYYRFLGFRLLGASWFPWWMGGRLWRDGIDMSNTVIVGGIRLRLLEGDTLAHEVGHWLGLYHTFQGGCSQNDGVLDTNAEASPASFCPIGRDTCPGGNIGMGLDPIHNFMAYTDDYCQFEFTPDQIDVMHVSHAVYRAERVPREILVLENGVTSEPLTLVEREMQVYSYELETAGAPVTCVTSYIDEFTGTPCVSDCYNGDADLYLRWGSEPARYYENDCFSTGPDSFESCTSIQDLNETTLYVGVYAERTFLDVTTTCSENYSLIPLANNTPSAPVSLAESVVQILSFPVFFSPADVTCTSIGDSGNADLFLRFEEIPDIVNGLYDCSSTGDDSDEECSLAKVSPGRLFVSILATSGVSDLIVTCYETPSSVPIVLKTGVASDLLSLSTDEEQYYYYSFKFQHLSGARVNVTCSSSCDNGNADLFLRAGRKPDIVNGLYDCSSRGEGSHEDCSLADVRLSAVFISILATSSFDNLTVTCYEAPRNGIIVLENGVTADLLSLNENEGQYYSYPLPFPDATGSVNCSTVGSNGDADIILQWNVAPELYGKNDCRSIRTGSNERCEVYTPFGASNLYILVHAYRTFSNLRVTCSETRASNMPSAAPTETLAPTGESGAIALRNAVPFEFLSLPTDGEQYYLYVWPTPGAIGSVVCTTDGGNGDADMLVQWDDPPVRGGSFDCASRGSDSGERCRLNVPVGASRLYILVYAHYRFANVRVTCTEFRPLVLENAVPSDPVSLSRRDSQDFYYDLESPETTGNVTCTTVGSNGDVDLWLRWYSRPTYADSDCVRSKPDFSPNKTCEVEVPFKASRLYIRVYAQDSSSNVTVTCTERAGVSMCSRWRESCRRHEECCSGSCGLLGSCRLFPFW